MTATAIAVSEEWRMQAERDLEVAKSLAAQGYFEWAAYAAQQATEKAIKAVRHALAVDTRDDNQRSHKLIELVGPVLEVAPSTLPDMADLARVTQHEADGRYPGIRTKKYLAPLRVYDSPTAFHAILVAETVGHRCSRLTQALQAHWKTWTI